MQSYTNPTCTRKKRYSAKLYSDLAFLFLFSFCILHISTAKVNAASNFSLLDEVQRVDPVDTTNTVYFELQFTAVMSGLGGGSANRYIKVSFPTSATIIGVNNTAATVTTTSNLITLDYGNSGLPNGTYTFNVVAKFVNPNNASNTSWGLQAFNNANNADGGAQSRNFTLVYQAFTPHPVTIENTPTVNANISAPVQLAGGKMSVLLDKTQIEKGVALALAAGIGFIFIKRVGWRSRR